MKLKLSSIDVHLSLEQRQLPEDLNPENYGKYHSVVNCTPQEAFTMISMPALAGLVYQLVPQYEVVLDELPEMSEKEG